jgi:hypothetical protein
MATAVLAHVLFAFVARPQAVVTPEGEVSAF